MSIYADVWELTKNFEGLNCALKTLHVPSLQTLVDFRSLSYLKDFEYSLHYNPPRHLYLPYVSNLIVPKRNYGALSTGMLIEIILKNYCHKPAK